MAEAYPTPAVIYGLSSTRDQVIRYIGQTSTGLPETRLAAHRQRAKSGKAPLACWMRKEQAAGFDVRLTVLFWHGDAATSEKEYIALYRALGAPLLNVAVGADLSSPRAETRDMAPEARRKISSARRGRRHTEATKVKIMRAAYKRELAIAREGDYRLGSHLTNLAA